jgi:uncharacterized phage protein gp47/JayE
MPAQPAPYKGQVVAVERFTGRSGNPFVRITVGWAYDGPQGTIYEQVTLDYPLHSREALAFGVKGRCVGVLYGELKPCR